MVNVALALELIENKNSNKSNKLAVLEKTITRNFAAEMMCPDLKTQKYLAIIGINRKF